MRAWAAGLLGVAMMIATAGRVSAQLDGGVGADGGTATGTGADAGTGTDAGTGAGTGAGTDAGVGLDDGLPPGTDVDDAQLIEEEGEGAELFPIRYFLERVAVRGNTRTAASVIRAFVSLRHGDVIDVDDPELAAIRWRLLGTGWFRDAQISFTRGRERGWIVLVIRVRERNTIVIQGVTLGIADSVQSTLDEPTLFPYAGIALAETNLLGTGIGLSGAVAYSTQPQWGARLRFSDPSVFGSRSLLAVGGFFNRAREYFGDGVLVVLPPCMPMDPVDCEPDQALVVYDRGGLSIGTGTDFGATTRYTLDFQAEVVNVRRMPTAASDAVGPDREVRPIVFPILDELSFVNTLQFGLTWDRRDDPSFPTRGVNVQLNADLGSAIIGSDYDFLRIQTMFRLWLPLAQRHTLRLGAFGGVIFGDAPFFYQFYASDLSDLIPSRVLELNLDRRGSPNLFNTAAGDKRIEEIGGRLDVEYGMRFFDSEGWLRVLQGYVNLGVYVLIDPDDFAFGPPGGYEGFGRVPMDLTFDLGVRADTDLGVFQVGFSTLIGFLPAFSP